MSEREASEESLAILDDYAGIAKRHFSSISQLAKIESFPETLNPHDPAELERLVSRLEDFTILSTMRERTALPSTLLCRLPKLRLILTTGRRNAAIDLTHCRAHDIPVTGTTGTFPVHLDAANNPIPPATTSLDPLPPPPPPPPTTVRTLHPTPSAFPPTVQHTLSLLLALTSRITHDHAHLTTPPHTGWQSGLTTSLAGKTLGVLGLGVLGSRFARAAHLALGMRVLAWSPNLTAERAAAAATSLSLPPDTFTPVPDKRALFERADVVSLHLVLGADTRGVVSRDDLSVMRPHALLVNTARAGLVDQDALWDVLWQGKIAGAALDVFWGTEPLASGSRWRRFDALAREKGREGDGDGRPPGRLVLSPHMGYVTEEGMEGWYAEQAVLVRRWLAGEELRPRLA